MMDLKEIIKWFIPCFHILLIKLDRKMIFVCLFLFFKLCASADVNSGVSIENTKKLVNNELVKSELYHNGNDETSWNLEHRSSIGEARTFGRPFKKMMGAMLPIIFQIGAASTWAVVAALVGIKTLAVTLIILKLLLVAGAAKMGALFASKTHSQHESWSPPTHQNKEIHLHIHNSHGNEHHEEHVPLSTWNREGSAAQSVNYIYDPYKAQSGPQTISTPFGNYVKIDAT